MDDDIFNEFQSEDGSGDLEPAPSCSNYQMKSSVADKITDEDEEDVENEMYKAKYRRIKKIARGLIFENACLCDEVAQLQEKIVIAKEERRFLLRKLLAFEAQKEKDEQMNLLSICSSGGKGSALEGSEAPPTKKRSSAKKKTQQKSDEPNKSRSKKKKPPPEKRMVQPIPLDCSGRPIFPILLDDLTVHSLGVIIHDRGTFHSEESIFPVGYCSSRMYNSLKNPLQQCLYTCTVLDNNYAPRFEITPEDDLDHPIVGNTLDECHRFLLNASAILCGKELGGEKADGVTFFGLSHPVVQNLIQSCAGARKCTSYRWIQFEVSKPKNDDLADLDCDDSINYEVLQKLMMEMA